ncbi:hypothetical protein H4R18_004946 [Coemansia javaensis]|uniref:Fe2OG dioxygenase domain-containing protein n=1 Tax=Coemansia javaensis TaxID=2761396 RepID=A0A9W8H4N9_9FUNG|nr:hypothetical protein H4R18_004946 [Coemansia javaensis]
MADFTAIPVLDLHAAQTDRARFLAELRHALIHVGFFYVANHGISGAFLAELARQTAAFFELPPSEKMRVDKIHSPTFLGYSAQGNEITKGQRDNREQFDFANELPDMWTPGRPVHERLTGPNLWPREEALPGFRATLLSFNDQAQALAEQLARLAAEALGLHPEALLAEFVAPGQQHRSKLVKYPAVDQLAPGDGTQGVGPHRDTSSLLTILFQATGQPGLQVQNHRGAWVDAPPLPGTFVVNIGTGLEYLAQGVPTATTHRVLNPPPGTGPRYSVPFFLGTRLDRPLTPLPLPQAVLDARPERVVSDSDHQFHSLLSRDPGTYYLLNRISSHRDVAAVHYPDLAAAYGYRTLSSKHTAKHAAQSALKAPLAFKASPAPDFDAGGVSLEFPLLSIDYAQGESDINFVFFYAAPRGRHRRRRRVPVARVVDALLQTARQFPVLLGRLAGPGSDRSSDDGNSSDGSSAGWRVVVDPADPNWPAVTEARAHGHTIAALRRAHFAWAAWPPEAAAADLHTRPALPMLGLHVVHYACGGVSLHTKIRHQIMDGSAAWRFYAAWARASAASIRGRRHLHLQQQHVQKQQHGLKHGGSHLGDDPPVLDRRLLSDRIAPGHAPPGETCPGLLRPPPDGRCIDAGHQDDADRYIDGVARFLRDVARCPVDAEAAAEPFAVRRFVLSAAAIARLKREHGAPEAACSAAGARYVREHGIRFLSTNDLLCAVFWRAIARAHAALRPGDPHACLMIACDVRARVGAPAAYCGNASFPLLVHATTAQLAAQPLADTAARIRRRVAAADAPFAARTAALLASPAVMRDLFTLFHPARALLSASIISHFPMYATTDFGFGTPTHIDIPDYLTPGFSIWMPARDPTRPTTVNLALTDRVFALIQADPEFRRYVDISP